MGKGKGMIERKVMRVRRGFVLFEFKGVHIIKLKRLVTKINKKLDVKFIIYKKDLKKYGFWIKTNKFLYYINKYLFV
jgi:ribosomal protein L16/L10AE